MEQKVTITDATAKVAEIFESGRSIKASDYFVKILKLTRVVKRLVGLVESKDMGSQIIPGLVKEARRLRGKLIKAKMDKD